MELVQLLMSNLNIEENQAKGGAGLLFNLAKSKLGDESFGQIAQYVPGIESLQEAAPESGGVTNALGGLASALGGVDADALGGLASVLGGGDQLDDKLEALGSAAGLVEGFSKLGLDGDMVTKFAPIIMSFIESKGGGEIKELLAGIL